MDEPSRGIAAHAWRRWFWLWDLFFALGYAAMLVLLFREDDATNTDHVVAVSALTAFALWYLTFGRPRITAEDESVSGGRIYMAGAAALLVLGVVFQQSMLNLLFAFCPMAFMALSLNEAIVVVISANLLPPLSVLVEDGYEAMMRDLVPSTVFLLLFSVLLGTWVTRIVAQSEERAALIKELEESREEIGRLSREAGVAAERARLAAEIHDTLAQGFTSLVTLVQAAESELDGDTAKARKHLTLAARTARENLTEARALVAGLMPTALGTGSLDQAIRRQLERFAEETAVAVTYQAEGDSVALPTVLEVVLLRMVQESLTNVRRHAEATAVTISLRVNENHATLRVSDNGSGFDQAMPADGFGLRGMRNRAAQVGGTLSVHSGENGTTVELEVPR
ncbi:sensor histidine kinase [Actinophytocola algeriensis]|uniref:Signal transduction histidine kinase n=1 Tax=Actinophytocola algeriensis TaxID=1768010 RepID=A0A7W7VJE3_9PSEU|nr:sensor histidine kinase [Actinophytocola algeriensis]MBB4912552.1 signal transduction histidine kinase [Actinophytocola algeriensis]MBE1478926.1 signal transduction histidine kinase [Actinophytocola algeriensis]